MNKTFCEFFAGIGLVHEALRRTGWLCVYANDIAPKKKAMYEGHFGPSPYFHLGDVWNADEVLSRISGRPFLATASFPCTDMSLAGKRRGLAGEQSGAFFGFTDIIRRMDGRRPAVVLLENVPGFLTSRDGEDFQSAAAELADLGYWLDAFVLDAKWFVPQSRPRLFLVGFQEWCIPPIFPRHGSDEGVLAEDWLWAMAQSASMRPARLAAAIDRTELATGWLIACRRPPRHVPYELADFIGVSPDEPWWDQAEVDRHVEMMFERHRLHLREAAGEGDRPRVFTGFRRVRKGRQRLEVRFDGLAGCLRTPRGGSAKQIVISVEPHRLRMRWMTPREYARLQGAPQFVLPDNVIQGLFGFGDAVCVPAIEWIDREILTPVFEAANDARPVLSS